MRHLRLHGPLAALALSVACCAHLKPPATAQRSARSAASTLPDPLCQLPAPKKGVDPCTTDADCASSTPCHAYQCVTKAKCEDWGGSYVCTNIMLCDTADANRCGCFEGRCSLIPPPPGS
jgi:hypothetical protein